MDSKLKCEFRGHAGATHEPVDDTLKWEYECLSCRARFRIEVPKGPSEERRIRCPQCESNQLERIKVPLSQTACGG